MSAPYKNSYGYGSMSRPVTLPRALFIRRLRFLFAEFLEAWILDGARDPYGCWTQGGGLGAAFGEATG